MTPPATHRVRLHFKVLKLLPGEPGPKMTPQAMKDCMSKVYAPHGIDVVVAPAVEDLDLEVLTDLTVGGCSWQHDDRAEAAVRPSKGRSRRRDLRLLCGLDARGVRDPGRPGPSPAR